MENSSQILIMGVFATLVIDLWAMVLKHGFKQPTMDWGMVGRWFAYLPRGVVVHRPIGKTDSVAHEKLVGWSAHYIIGIVYAWVYMSLITLVFSMQPTLMTAVAFGLATLVAPWLILQPGLGMGVFARKTPNPGIKRLTSLSVHAIFGVALFIGWRIGSGI